jgi:Transposase, Mutator family
VSTRRVDQLVESLGLRVSRSEVSRICAGLDDQVEAFRTRPLEGRYVYLFLDAKVEKVRDGGRVQRKCVVIAHGVHETGRREIIALDVGAAETEAFWTEFLRELVARGLVGVQLVISDAHEGLKNAIAKVLGAPWQRCTVHFLRDCLGHARRDQHGLLAALIRPLFNADSPEQARDRLSEAVAALDGKLPKVATMLEQAEDDILAFYAFPTDHWRKLRSTDEIVKHATRLRREFRAMDRSRWRRRGPEIGSCGLVFRRHRRNGPISGSVGRRRLGEAFDAGLVVGARLRSGRGRPRAKSRVWGYEPCRAACPVEGLESRAPLAAATPFSLFGAFACQSATSWR